MYLAQNIKFLRKERRVNQDELCEVMGVTRSQISSYERGISEPKFDGLIKLSQYFNVFIDDLILKDLTNEDARPAGKAPQTESEREQLLATLNDQLLKRLTVLEQHLKEVDPEQAKKWGIE